MHPGLSGPQWLKLVKAKYRELTTHADGTRFSEAERKEVMDPIINELHELEEELAEDLRDDSAVTRMRKVIEVFTEAVRGPCSRCVNATD